MKNKTLLLILILIAIIAAIILIEKPFMAKSSVKNINQVVELKVGGLAPYFSLIDTTDKKVSLSDFIGKKAVIINFWASWCVACVSEMPLLQEASQTYKKDLVVLGVNRQESKNDAIKFAYFVGVTFPLLLDNDRSVNDLYHVLGLPATFFVNKDGVITGFKRGELNSQELYNYIQDMI